MAELILALDLPDANAARRLLERLPEARWVKIGSILFAQAGPELVRALVAEGRQVFLDLKWHDIPNTVAGAVAQARDLGASLATVHTLGGTAMLEAAARASEGVIDVVGVTVLTSHDASALARVLGRAADTIDLTTEVRRLARLALEAGLAGTVCSPHEVQDVVRLFGGRGTFVVPGIRSSGDSVDDQSRVATAAQAARAGATHLVVGRPVLQAAEPAKAFALLQQEAVAAAPSGVKT